MTKDSPASSVDLCVLWGTNPEDDTPASYSFSSTAACMAFVQGVNVASGFMEANFVAGPNYYVNKDGEITQRQGKAAVPVATERYVIFEEHPEPGTRAERYAFGTQEEAAAFEQGVSAMVGWTKYHWVPSADHRHVVDEDALNDEQTTGWLTPEGRAKLLDLAAQEELPFPIFATPEGEWVSEDWAPELSSESSSNQHPAKAPKSKM